MKTISVLCVGSVVFLIGLRLAGVTTEIPSLDRWVRMLMDSMGVG